MKRLFLVLIFMCSSGAWADSNIHLAFTCESLSTTHLAFVKGFLDIKTLSPVGPLKATGTVGAIVIDGNNNVNADNLKLKSYIATWKAASGVTVKFRGNAKVMGFERLHISTDLYDSKNILYFKGRQLKMRCIATTTMP